MTIDKFQLKVTTTGSAGSATGSTTSNIPIRGKIHAVHINWHASAPGATSDITVGMAGAPTENFVAISNSATDVWLYPRRATHDSAGVGLLYASGGEVVADKYIVHDHIVVSVTGCDPLTDAVVVTIYYEP